MRRGRDEHGLAGRPAVNFNYLAYPAGTPRRQLRVGEFSFATGECGKLTGSHVVTQARVYAVSARTPKGLRDANCLVEEKLRSGLLRTCLLILTRF